MRTLKEMSGLGMCRSFSLVLPTLYLLLVLDIGGLGIRIWSYVYRHLFCIIEAKSYSANRKWWKESE